MIWDKNKKLKIKMFLDGRPGHEKQTKGIVQELGYLVKTEVSEITIRKKSFWQELFGWVGYYFWRNSSLVEEQVRFDLIIGTGSRTHIPMLLYKKKHGTPVVTCMSPSPLLINEFDLCCVPQHDGLKNQENIFQTIGPPNCSVSKNEHLANHGLILLGGIDTKSHHWCTGTIEKYLTFLLNDQKIQYWTITSSPRTPEKTSLMVELLIEQYEGVEFFRFEETEKGWIENQYNLNKFVWVTADSMSMVYEALTAGCHVGLLPVVWEKKKSKFRRSEEFLIKEGFVVSLDSWGQSDGWWPSRGALNEAARCAKEIVKRL